MDDDDNDGKDKSVIDKLMDVVTTGVSEVAKAALPSGQMTNGQLLVGDAAIAPEAVPAPTAKPAHKKRADAPYRANRRVAAARARTAKGSVRETAPKTVAKGAKKTAAKKPPPKKKTLKAATTKPSKKTAKSAPKKNFKQAKKAAPKKFAKKSKKSKR